MTRAGRTPSGFEDGDEVLGKAVSKLQAQVLSPVDKERCKDCCRLVYFGDGERKDFASKLAWQKKGPLRFSVPSRICRGVHPPADWTWWGDHNSVGPSPPRQLPTLPLCEARQPVTTTAPTTGVGPNPRRHSSASPIHPYILSLTLRLFPENTAIMSSHADNKDRQFLAVIGDEVRRDAIPGIKCHADRNDNRTQ